LVPGHGALAGVPVEGDEVGCRALLEVPEQVVEILGVSDPERAEDLSVGAPVDVTEAGTGISQPV
jgi:hypothetical protein